MADDTGDHDHRSLRDHLHDAEKAVEHVIGEAVTEVKLRATEVENAGAQLGTQGTAAPLGMLYAALRHPSQDYAGGDPGDGGSPAANRPELRDGPDGPAAPDALKPSPATPAQPPTGGRYQPPDPPPA